MSSKQRVTVAQRLDFEGFETHFVVSGTPTMYDMIPPYDEFRPESLVVRHISRGHRSATGQRTHVSVRGPSIERQGGRGWIQWDTDDLVLHARTGKMPDWLRQFVRVHAGIDLTEWHKCVTVARKLADQRRDEAEQKRRRANRNDERKTP